MDAKDNENIKPASDANEDSKQQSGSSPSKTVPNDGQGTPKSFVDRLRTDSESSTDSMNRFVLPSLDGSPPKIVTMDEVSSMFKNLRNMELAHEIALNPDFKLQQYKPPQDTLEGRITTIVHNAFWDLLRQQLELTPPCYDQAIRLLADIKECFPDIIAPSNSRALVHINSVLDDTVIRQQAERGVLDFKVYSDFVINILARSCSPARDEAVAKLRELTDVVDTFRGILEIMTLMKLDMANYMIATARKGIAANSVEYEKEKFSKYLREYEGNIGFPATEDWLKRNRTAANSSNDESIYNAYIELLDWPSNKDFPEVLSIDQDRFNLLRWRGQRLILCASLISIAQSSPIISQRRENRIKLANQLDIIVQDVKKEEQIVTAMEGCYEQIKSFINEALAEEQAPAMTDAVNEQLKAQVMQLVNKSSPVRALMSKRLDGYVRVTLRSNGSIPPPPSGFTEYQQELVAFIASYRRLVSYNHAVFGDYFMQMLKKMQQSPPATQSPESPADVSMTSRC